MKQKFGETFVQHQITDISVICYYYSARSLAGLQPNIIFALRRVLAVFTRSAITPSKANRFDETWSILSITRTQGLALADFGLDPRNSDSCRARRNFILFLSGKQRTISPISRQPNYTKFGYNTSIGKAIKTFGTEFRKFYRNGSFFQKNAKISPKCLTPSDFRRPYYNSALLIDLWKFTTKWSLYGMSSFHFYHWNQFITHSPRRYAPYKKPLQIFGDVWCPILGKPSTPLFRLADGRKRKAGPNTAALYRDTIRYDTIRYIYVRSKAEEMASFSSARHRNEK